MGLISNGTTVFDAGAMSLGGSMTFIKKLTASSSASLQFIDGASGVVFDSTYKEYVFTFKNSALAKLVRYLFLKIIIREESLDQLATYKNYDLILTLSLTDDIDTLLVGFGKKHGIKTIGTVRSWDNLSSHGLLRVKPDSFYSHSEAMTRDLLKYQF